MAKKKKTQLKPVARGFATTSLPKKIDAPEETLPDSTLVKKSDDDTPRADESGLESMDGKSAPPSASDNGLSNIMSPEDQYLQGLLERLQEKTEKEISRALKAIEVDRRYSRTLPRLDIDSGLRDRILEYALVENVGEGGQKFFEDAEEKALFRLGVTYGTLRRLGFSEDRVDECLRNMDGLDTEDAFTWLYLRCSEDELIFKKPEDQKLLTLKLAAGITVRRHLSPPSTPRLPPGSLSRTKLHDEAADTPAISKNVKTPEPAVLIDTEKDRRENRFLAGHAEILMAGDDSDADSDSKDPTIEYVRLKLLQDEINVTQRDQIAKARSAKLQRKMDEISKDYLFDKKEALSKYAHEKKKTDRNLLQHRLKFLHPESDSGPIPPSSSVTEAAPGSTAPSAPVNDVWADDSDDSSTGVLGILEEPDAKELTIQGVTFALREMTLPKHWSGPMPKTLLRDFVVKSDRYAAISYSMISNHSRAKRASVSISWQNRTRDEWSMDDVACPDDSQAEQYVAAVALHSLTYPLTEGFIASTPATNGSATSFRLLPAVYRALWDELEASRKTRDEMANRSIWANLRRILKDKSLRSIKLYEPAERQSKVSSGRLSQSVTRATLENKSNFDAAAAAFQVRQTTSAYQDILAQRNRLPIARYRERIVDILEHSQVLVLSGETGCGKSTQVPSFLLEDSLSKGKPCRIFCTEPRRISAMSLAQRVAYELCDPPNFSATPNSLVGYSIRLESHISRNTRLAFVTNGIALRMLEGGTGQNGSGTAFDEITHLIIDEVHERSIESDFLLIVLKSLLVERPDLKVILMSATLDAEKISAYFGNCETLQVPGRTYPVEVQYLEDAIEYTKWFIAESSPYARRLHDKYYRGKNKPEWTEDLPSLDDEDEDSNDAKTTGLKLEKRYSAETASTLNTIDERLIPYELIVRLLEKICYADHKYQAFSAAVLIFMPGLGEIRRLHDLLVEHPVFGSNDFSLHPLHSSLSTESQGAVFDIPPAGIRKIVIATNIAETGITIPDITCVIDTGKHREMRFDEKRQISRLVETFIAKSNAAQRRGRAGRVQHGLCFHLFTKMRHDTQMADSPLPEMMRLSLSDLALRIKIMKVNLGPSIEDVLSRALDPPILINVQRAVSMLIEVRALTPSEEITPMGRLLSKLPTDVHLGKFLLISTVFGCLDPALTIAATLNSKSPFVAPLGLEQEADRAKNSFRVENSDFLTIHNAFSSWRRACANPGIVRKFCRSNFLSHQNLQQIEDLRQQFLGYLIDSSFIQVDKSLVRELSRARYSRNRTRFVTVPSELDANSNKPALIHAALAAGLYPKILSIDAKTGKLLTISNNQAASFHPTSVNFGRNALDFGVSYLTYFTLMHSKKLYAWETGPVDDLSILLLCGEADHKLISDSVSIDRKIRFSIPPKTHIALKILREKINAILAQQYQGRPLTDMQLKWMETCLLALSKIKLAAADEPAIGIRLVSEMQPLTAS